MIYSKDMEIISRAIRIYNSRQGREYLLAVAPSRQRPLSFIRVRIEQGAFWHLLGCKFMPHISAADKEEYFRACLSGNDIRKVLSYTGRPTDVGQKYAVFAALFDFVAKAPSLRICWGDAFQVFEIGAGSSGEWYFPKTTLAKSIYEIDAHANHKIFFVLSRQIQNIEKWLPCGSHFSASL